MKLKNLETELDSDLQSEYSTENGELSELELANYSTNFENPSDDSDDDIPEEISLKTTQKAALETNQSINQIKEKYLDSIKEKRRNQHQRNALQKKEKNEKILQKQTVQKDSNQEKVVVKASIQLEPTKIKLPLIDPKLLEAADEQFKRQFTDETGDHDESHSNKRTKKITSSIKRISKEKDIVVKNGIKIIPLNSFETPIAHCSSQYKSKMMFSKRNQRSQVCFTHTLGPLFKFNTTM